jgi:glucose-1-phosphate thymidylyltransferase
LEHGNDNSAQAAAAWPESIICPPVNIHPSARIHQSVIGPNVVVEAGCRLERVVARHAIIQQDSSLQEMLIEQSLIGRNQTLKGVSLHVRG